QAQGEGGNQACIVDHGTSPAVFKRETLDNDKGCSVSKGGKSVWGGDWPASRCAAPGSIGSQGEGPFCHGLGRGGRAGRRMAALRCRHRDGGGPCSSRLPTSGSTRSPSWPGCGTNSPWPT